MTAKALQHVKIEASQCSNYSPQEGLFDKAQGRGQRSRPVCLPCLPTWTRDHSLPRCRTFYRILPPCTQQTNKQQQSEKYVSFGKEAIRDTSFHFIMRHDYAYKVTTMFLILLSLSRRTWLISNYDKALLAASKLSLGSRPSSP